MLPETGLVRTVLRASGVRSTENAPFEVRGRKSGPGEILHRMRVAVHAPMSVVQRGESPVAKFCLECAQPPTGGSHSGYGKKRHPRARRRTESGAICTALFSESPRTDHTQFFSSTSRPRAAIVISASFSANASAIARPILLEPPVTVATLFFEREINFHPVEFLPKPVCRAPGLASPPPTR